MKTHNPKTKHWCYNAGLTPDVKFTHVVVAHIPVKRQPKENQFYNFTSWYPVM